MTTLTNMLKACKGSPERVEFHPERTLERHIALVVLRAMIWGEKEHVFSALLHDLCKPCSGEMKNGFWSNPKHPSQAVELIESNDDVRLMLKLSGVDVRRVKSMVKFHMDVKTGEAPKKGVFSANDLELFKALDDMVFRTELPAVEKRVCVPGFGWVKGSFTFLGLAPVHVNSGKEVFTLTFNRLPATLTFEQLLNVRVMGFNWVNTLLKKAFL